MEQRLIDANALKATIRPADSDDCRNALLLSDVRKILHNFVDNAPTVDAVPVVRCGECLSCERHFKRNGEPHHYRCSFFDIEIEPQDFCSYGERRDGDG